MFGNGAAIAGMITTMTHRLTEVLGKLEQIITECGVVVPGTTMRSIAVVPIVVVVPGTTMVETTAGRAAVGGARVFA